MINAIKTLLIALSAIPAVISQNDCLEAAYGSPLSCTEDEIHVVDAIIIQDVTNIVIHDDGCQYPGDTVDFTGDFHLTSSGRNRFDIGLWFSVDGDPNGDGSLNGVCRTETPFYNRDGDSCGDFDAQNSAQIARYRLQVVCKRSPDGWLTLPWCSSWHTARRNRRCSGPSDTVPVVPGTCKCDRLFTVSIPVPENSGGGDVVGDPHFETWYHRRYDYQGICDLVFLRSPSFSDGSGLDIHIRTSEREGTSFISTAAIRIGNDKLEVHQDGSYHWNNELVQKLPPKFGTSTMTFKVVDGYLPVWEIKTPKGGVIYVQVFDTMVDVKVFHFGKEEMSDSEGLLGDYTSGFLEDRKGNWMFDTDKFGLEWQVRDNEDMLFREAREPQYPTRCSMPDAKATERLLENANISLEEARSLCEKAGGYYDACVQDLRLFGNINVATAYALMSKIGNDSSSEHLSK